jgi:hypothetical protein
VKLANILALKFGEIPQLQTLPVTLRKTMDISTKEGIQRQRNLEVKKPCAQAILVQSERWKG